MSSNKRASLSSNSPLDQLFSPSREREEPVRENPPAAPETRMRQEREAQAPPRGSLVEEDTVPAPEEMERELRQTTIMIYGDQADWLDEACYLARRESGSNLSKAAILRALVDMAREDEGIRMQLRERLGIGA